MIDKVIKTILPFLGIASTVAGIVIASITANWSTVAIIFLLVGLTILIFNLLFGVKKYQFWQKPSTKQGANALATTTIVLVIIAVINALGIRYNLRWDVTENQLHTISAQSQAVLAKLEQPLEVLVFDRNIDPNLENLLQNYRRQNERFQFRFVNPEQELGLAQEYGVQSLGEIYLKYANKRQKLDSGNLVVGEPIAETQITNAIEKIQSDRSINIYLLQGHGEASPELVERGISQAVTNLETRGYTVGELNLAREAKIPDDASLIIIAGATKKLLAGEISSLQQYLAGGGNLLLLLSPNTDIGIKPWLQQWGIELDNRLIVDGSGAGNIMGFGPGVIIVNNYGDHPITSSFGKELAIFPESRPLKIKQKTAITTTPLVITDDQTWAESNLKEEEIIFDPNQDLSGPLNIAVAISRPQPKSSRLVIFGSSTFATNGWFEQQLNGDLLLNSVSWLVGQEQETLSTRLQEVTNRRLQLSPMRAKVISWLALRIIPFLALLSSAFYWSRSR
ncbi:MAG: Gldg family protein [Pleurocapsa sp. MO_226.B13]|nr:Gldg family protein [Pleurocapsa sp. MO_226.B13]